MAGDFRKLKIWQKAHTVVLDVYKETIKFPKEELYGLVAQIRRAIVSVSANIVEGNKRKSKKDFLHFLNMAEGSLEEVKYYLILSYDLKYLSKDAYNKLYSKLEEIGIMVNSFKNSLKVKLSKGE